jgi:hypothetical protein
MPGERVKRDISLANAVTKSRMRTISHNKGRIQSFGEILGSWHFGKKTYIEKVIFRQSQASSSHQPSPRSLLAPENMSVGHSRLAHATPPSFFARAGSAANNSSLHYHGRVNTEQIA